MNACSRLITFLEKRQAHGQDYFATIRDMTAETDRYGQLGLARYLQRDLDRVRRWIEQNDPEEFETFHRPHITEIAEMIQPFKVYTGTSTPYNGGINRLRLYKVGMPDEPDHRPWLGEVMEALEQIGSAEAPEVQEILDDLRKTVEYYEFFGEAVIVDQYYRISGNFILHAAQMVKEKKKELILGAILTFMSGAVGVVSTAADVAQLPENIQTIERQVCHLIEQIGNQPPEVIDVEAEEGSDEKEEQ